MNVVILEAAALIMTALLGGMETVCGARAFRENHETPGRIWRSRLFHRSTAVWLFLLVGAWYAAAAAAGGISHGIARPGYLAAARTMSMFLTYILLTAVDVHRRIIPDQILLCYFAGQLLMAAAGGGTGWVRCLAEGCAFALLLMAVSWMLKGKIGMGDAKLLGVTAMTAGWFYTVQILIIAMALSFIAGVWLLVFRRMSAKTEVPFVPFLTAGMAAHFFLLLKL